MITDAEGEHVCRPEELRDSVGYPSILALIQDSLFFASNTLGIFCARYYRIFAGVALSFLDNDAAAKTKLDAISALMAYTLAEGDITVKDHHCEVKKKVEEMYVGLELDCDMVGVKSSLPTDCPTDCWTNMGVEHYFYIPQSDVFKVGELSLDVPEGRGKAR